MNARTPGPDPEPDRGPHLARLSHMGEPWDDDRDEYSYVSGALRGMRRRTLLGAILVGLALWALLIWGIVELLS